MSKSSYTINQGQTLVDVAIDHYGDASMVFQLLSDNPALSGPDQLLVGGESLVIDETLSAARESTSFDMIDSVSSVKLSERVQIEVGEGQTLTDLVITHYGDLSYIFQLLEDNPQIQSPDSQLTAGEKIWINRTLAQNQPTHQFSNIDLVRDLPESPVKNTLIYDGQSLMDLALQEYGDIAAVFDLEELLSNNIGSFVAPAPGTMVSIRKNRVYDAAVTEYYQNRNIKVNTGKGILIEGIGLCSSDGILLVSIDNFILKASDL